MQPSESRILEELELVLASRGFAASQRLSRFLRFIVERTLAGDRDSLKESIVGVEVFDRRSTYNPKTEPIVRTEARRLRARLAEYYESNHAAIVISVPLGGYVAAFTEVRCPEPPAQTLELVPRRQRANPGEVFAMTVGAGYSVPLENPRPESAPTLHPPRPTVIPQRSTLTDPPPGPRKYLIGAALVAIFAAGLGWSYFYAFQRVPTGPVSRFTIRLPAGQEIVPAEGNVLALSPDGQWLAYIARQSGVSRLYLRRLDAAEGRLIPGSESAISPAFASDGKSLAIYQSGKLRRIWLDGPEKDLVPVADQFPQPGLAWDRTGNLFFNNAPSTHRDRASSIIFRLPASGPPVEPLTPVNLALPDSRALMVQQALPTGHKLLVSGRAPPPHERFIGILSPGNPSPTIVMEDAIGGLYTAFGQLVFYRGGELLAAPLDVVRARIIGPAVPVLKGVRQSNWQGPDIAVSQSGTLAYVEGLPTIPERTLLWVDRAGHEKPLAMAPCPCNPLDISPDGRQLLFARFEALEQTWTLWTYGLVDNVARKIAGPSPDIIVACFSRDGRNVIFGSKQHDRALGEILSKRVDGSGEETQISAHAYFGHFPQAASPDGKWVAFVLGTMPDTKGDIWLVDLRQPGHPISRPFVESPGWDANPAISPDGRWIAYESSAGPTRRIFLQPFPDGGTPIAVPSESGSGPLWSPDSRTLYYRSGARMMSVTVLPAMHQPVELFRGDYMSPGTWQRMNLLSPEGDRFLLAREDPSRQNLGINVVVNWFSELSAKLRHSGL
jgi:eukaryotic-like serine/threonine-protein kinase